MHCPLCASDENSDYHRDDRRPYRQCGTCDLVFVPPTFHLDAAREKAEYDLHENNVDDPGYRRFLSRLATPMLQHLTPGSSGLDFGCGPGPALAAMLGEAGHCVTLYDIYYHPETAPLGDTYDFVCATEVVEHLAQPGMELSRLWHCLRPGGVLGVMTKLVRNPVAFATWHYKSDPTHICFFSRATWRWWAERHGGELEILGSDVILLHKPG
ncbi:class I SAM-dependent methyltransferase [Halioglobus maricola]|uniref:Class I SAM-dependent methyltransferase n=1 Tax=Halioglobus maricola TaxID=2601894 RepID=A0A5P9NQ38_9GAMM|nr:class I SAM-dependent methyltransferase [Halioglobus maricola]